MVAGGVVVNPRGTSGAGKTELVRRVMRAYGARGADHGPATPLIRPSRPKPIGWLLPHPAGGRPLAVLGDYGATRGGCDTIPLRDGGTAEALRLADGLARRGCDVLLEGFGLSGDTRGTEALAARGHRVHVLFLATPLELCIHNVIRRRRAGRAVLPAIRRTAETGQAGLDAALAALLRAPALAEVSVLPFAEALARTRALLGLPAASGGTDAALVAEPPPGGGFTVPNPRPGLARTAVIPLRRGRGTGRHRLHGPPPQDPAAGMGIGPGTPSAL